MFLSDYETFKDRHWQGNKKRIRLLRSVRLNLPQENILSLTIPETFIFVFKCPIDKHMHRLQQ